jgi:3-hydroxyacyl-[acyl-carrier-protein] dehydratase
VSRELAAPLDAVDRIETSADGHVEAVKEIVASDPYLSGHYPGFPVYPGVFTIETVYQAARRVAEQRHGPAVRAELAGVTSVRFSAPLLPGDVLHADCTLSDADDPELLRVRACCRRSDGTVAARMTLDLLLRREGPDA